MTIPPSSAEGLFRHLGASSLQIPILPLILSALQQLLQSQEGQTVALPSWESIRADAHYQLDR